MRWTAARVGLIAGFLAAAAQAFFRVIPPPAYGICIACHMRDLVNWLVIRLYPLYGTVPGGARFVGAPVSKLVPVLTVVGALVGAHLAARRHGEFRFRAMRVPWQRPWAEFLLGMGVMVSALLMGGCPIRTALKSAYLDLTAMVGLVAIFLGVVLGCQLLRRLS